MGRKVKKSRLAIWLDIALLTAVAGCNTPGMSLNRVTFAGDHIIVRVGTYTTVPNGWEPSHDSNFHTYAVAFPVPHDPTDHPNADTVGELTPGGFLPYTSSSAHRVAISDPWGLRCDVVKPGQRGQGWKSALPQKFLPLALSTNGRYVIGEQSGYPIYDVTSGRIWTDESIARMIKVARNLPTHREVSLWLTRHLHYLVIHVVGATAEDVPKLTGGVLHVPPPPQHDIYTDYRLIVDLTSGSFVAAIPSLRFRRNELPVGLVAVDEDDDGLLLTLFSQSIESAQTEEFTIRSGNFEVIYRLTVPQYLRTKDEELPLRVEGTLDADHARVLLYAERPFVSDLRQSRLALCEWDYKQGIEKTMGVDLGRAFRRDGDQFVPGR